MEHYQVPLEHIQYSICYVPRNTFLSQRSRESKNRIDSPLLLLSWEKWGFMHPPEFQWLAGCSWNSPLRSCICPNAHYNNNRQKKVNMLLLSLLLCDVWTMLRHHRARIGLDTLRCKPCYSAVWFKHDYVQVISREPMYVAIWCALNYETNSHSTLIRWS